MPFETIEIETVNGKKIKGTFSSASEISLTMEVAGQTRQIPSAEVRRVWRREGSHVRKGMKIGFITGAVAGSILLASAYGAEAIVPATVVGGGTGLLYGALIGSFMHQRALVYQAGAPAVRVVPVVTPTGVGITASVRF
jgi:hypothetical protein